jgi:quaternary ammonium compound-resistance protein SugE|tara:strand:+ start:602 stop:946 length:345 start_codon:yes stop_codon:yes gene_type:complete
MLKEVEKKMVWIILLVAGVFEVGFAVGLKYTDGFTKLWPSVFTTISMIISVVLLSIALRNMPIGTGYSVWTGIGTIGSVVFGIAFFGEPANMLRLIFVVMIIGGIVGLKFAAGD